MHSPRPAARGSRIAEFTRGRRSRVAGRGSGLRWGGGKAPPPGSHTSLFQAISPPRLQATQQRAAEPGQLPSQRLSAHCWRATERITPPSPSQASPTETRPATGRQAVPLDTAPPGPNHVAGRECRDFAGAVWLQRDPGACFPRREVRCVERH